MSKTLICMIKLLAILILTGALVTISIINTPPSKNKLMISAMNTPSSRTNLIIFGDSLLDTTSPVFPSGTPQWDYPSHGNNYWVRVAITGAPIVDIDTFYRTPIKDGSKVITTKALWINYYAKDYAKGYLYPSRAYIIMMQQGQNHINLTDNNIDFAYATAETGDKYINDLSSNPAYKPYNTACTKPGQLSGNESCVPGMRTQIMRYLSLAKKIDKSNTHYILWGGSNDISHNLGKIISTYGATSSPKYVLQWLTDCTLNSKNNYVTFKKGDTKIILSCPVNNLATDVRLLVKNGVSPGHIMVIGLPDLSNTPNGGGNLILKLLSRMINLRLENAMTAQGVPVFSADILLSTIIKNPKIYGFAPIGSGGIKTYSCVEQVGPGAPFKKGMCRPYVFVKTHPTQHAGYCMYRSIKLWNGKTGEQNTPINSKLLDCNLPK